MMHLPVLTMMDQIGQIFSTISQVGLVVRGIYGEGTKRKGIYIRFQSDYIGQIRRRYYPKCRGVARQIISSERKIRKIFQVKRGFAWRIKSSDLMESD